MKCESCIFWRPTDEAKTTGNCYRHPPRIDDDEAKRRPICLAADFCGEWSNGLRP